MLKGEKFCENKVLNIVNADIRNCQSYTYVHSVTPCRSKSNFNCIYIYICTYLIITLCIGYETITQNS